MAMMTISDPGMAQGFQGLMSALGGGNVNGMIEADLNKGRRQLLTAQTGVEGQKLTDMQFQTGNSRTLMELLANPETLGSDEGRASLMSVLSGVAGGLQHGPGFATGAATFTDPNVFNPNDLSNVLLGTGVVNGWGDTPAGHSDKLNNDVITTGMDNDAAYVRALLPGGGSNRAPLTVSPDTTLDLDNMIAGALEAQYPGASQDPQLKNLLRSRVSQHYQTTRNAQMAVDTAMQEVQMALEGQSDGWFGLGSRPGTVVPTGQTVPQTAPVSDPTTALPPTTPVVGTTPTAVAPGAPPAASAPAAGASGAAPIPMDQLPPSLAKGVVQTPDGQMLYVDANGQSTPLQNGQVFTSPSNPANSLIWRDGQFWPYS